MQIAVIIPTLNEEATITYVLTSLQPSWKAVVVDDGSTDATATIAKAAGAIVVSHDTNRGYDAALTTGLNYSREAGFDAAVTIDADGQIPPELVAEALWSIEAGEVDLVLGCRPFRARWAESVFSTYVSWQWGVTDILCGLKAYRLQAFVFLPDFSMEQSIGTAVAMSGLRQGLRWKEIDVQIRPRIGVSRFGAGLKSNLRILWAATQTFIKDMRNTRG